MFGKPNLAVPCGDAQELSPDAVVPLSQGETGSPGGRHSPECFAGQGRAVNSIS